MQTYTRNRRRTQLRVESLEGKTLLSSGSVIHHIAHQVRAAPLVARATAAFSGTLTGNYSDVNVPFFASVENYTTSGTLSGVGSTHLHGTLSLRPGARSGRLAGQLLMRNKGGSMIVDVFQSATSGNYTYKVALAKGNDAAFKGGTGSLTITQSPTFNLPYYTFGQSTMTFS